MASSSNNHSSTSNRLTNSYFFYGTHPVKVPNNINHSNSTNNISLSSDQTTYHLSLENGSASLSETSTTKSLYNISTSCINDDDETSEIFEDAVESFNDEDENKKKSSRRSSAQQHDELIINLPQILIECQQINQLYLQNHPNEALRKAKARENRSFYHSLCHSTISFMQAAMTFNHDDIEATIQTLRHTSNMAKKNETYKAWLPFSLSAKPVMNEYELHAKLVYAEALLIRALLTFFQDQSLLSFISGALKIKECNDTFIKLAKHNDPSRFSSAVSYEHFDSGVRMGNGVFNLMISNLPQRIITYLQFVGFSGDREFGLNELEKSASTTGLRASFSALYLLIYHTVITPIFGNGDGDLEMCHVLVERYLKLYPDAYLFLLFRARLQTLHCQLHEAINTYEYAISCLNEWKNLHHIAYWEMVWCHVLQEEWKKAATLANTLLNENNWSKSTYCYLLATFLFEDNQRIATDEVIKLYKRVPELKIRLAGKSIPLEKYAMRQCEHFHAQQWLFLPALELVYLLNGFYILAHDSKKLKHTFDIVNNALNDLELHHRNDQYYVDSYGSGLLIRGVLLHFLHRYDEAHQSLDEVIHLAKQFDQKSFLVPNALLEKGLIYLGLKQKQKATEYLQKSLNDYKDYQLESRLQFRINTAMQTVKRMNH